MRPLFPAVHLAACLAALLLVCAAPAMAESAKPDPKAPELPVWNDPTTGMEFVLLPGGCFLMGSPQNEPGHEPGEETRQVCVDPFWMGRYEVTRAQFSKFADTAGYVTNAERQGWIRVWEYRWMNVYHEDWREPHFKQGDDEPVLTMDWDDAEAMAAWLSKRGNGRFRLPTEAEWEYAARAGTTTARYWGDAYDERVCANANVGDMTNIAAFGNLSGDPSPAAPCEDGYVFASPVGSFAPNAFGLYDMLGNAQEWCAEENPDDPKLGHMARGGSFLSITDDVRAAKREWINPEYGIYFTLGFRLARDK
ncbi:formylglycine-generating enzyme family protein [Paucidesulfovibrio longus]|uniref:formylglycine-generating enzyme family protein n=1 Tax=Paucidesulfovibrio longus TaxID=889 RepID=UPI0003B771FE|nr:SUMF1/EgtB/PvdO family nonheme iron enzyme [Paucidesulfovibrio longus]